MDPRHLASIAYLTIRNAQVSPESIKHLQRQAMAQAMTRWPLAGCALTYGHPEQLHIIAVGRQ